MAEYKFELPVSSEQLEAIGMVATEWSFLESVVEAAIWNYANIYDEDVGAALTTHVLMRNRLQMLMTLFHVQLEKYESTEHDERRRAELQDIVNTIDSLSAKRNRVIHTRWIRGDFGSPMAFTVQARGRLRRTKRGMPEAEIRGIAQQIAELSGKLQSFLELLVIEDEED